MTKIYYFIKLFFSAQRKLEVGAGKYIFDRCWLKTDKKVLDITNKRSWIKNFLFLRFDVIFSEHVWEHLEIKESKLALENCYRYLKKGGRVRIAVPDGLHPDSDYIEHVKPGGVGAGAHDHKVLYTYRSLSNKLEDVGFKIELKEYWDEKGDFHFVSWDSQKGNVRRSSRNDMRNSKKRLSYTSIIIDGIKC